MSVGMRRLVAIVVIGVVAVLLAGWVLLKQPFHSAQSSQTVTLAIPKGASVSQVGDLLERAGVIDSSSLFSLNARLFGDTSKIKAGLVTMNRGMTYSDALDALGNGGAVAAKTVSIPEGPSRSEVAATVRRQGVSGSYLDSSRHSSELDPRSYGAPSGASLEGFLFPATYQLALPATSTELVSEQLKAFRENFAKVDLSRARAKNLTPFDVITIAAMIERETAVASERPLVSAVIWNRLHKRIPLGIDATTRYEFNNWSSPVLQSQLSSDSQWNTRKRAGLPPGPIGNPGLASLLAAANPAHSPYLFYVVKPWTCGSHTFTVTQTQFDAAVAAYNSARESNGGRAPTKCP